MKNALILESRVVNEDQFGIGLAVKYQIALWITDHRIRILEIEWKLLAGGDVDCGSVTEKNRGDIDGVVSQSGFNNGLLGIRVVGGIRGADINIVSDERHIIVSAAVGWFREGVFFRLPILGIDDKQVWTGVVVLHGPQKIGLRVYLQSIVVSADFHFMEDFSVHGIFDDRAEPTGTIGLGIISVAYEHAAVPDSDRIRLVIHVRHAG